MWFCTIVLVLMWPPPQGYGHVDIGYGGTNMEPKLLAPPNPQIKILMPPGMVSERKKYTAEIQQFPWSQYFNLGGAGGGVVGSIFFPDPVSFEDIDFDRSRHDAIIDVDTRHKRTHVSEKRTHELVVASVGRPSTPTVFCSTREPPGLTFLCSLIFQLQQDTPGSGVPEAGDTEAVKADKTLYANEEAVLAAVAKDGCAAFFGLAGEVAARRWGTHTQPDSEVLKLAQRTLSSLNSPDRLIGKRLRTYPFRNLSRVVDHIKKRCEELWSRLLEERFEML